MSTLTIAKNWILGGRSLEFQTTLDLKPGNLSDIIDGCIRVVNSALFEKEPAHELLDFKGRSPHDILLPGIATPRTDELFRIGGVSAVEKVGADFAWEPFEVACYSPFNRFEGSHHIVHGTQIERAGGLPSWLPTRLLGCAAPIKPKFFRYGLEHFSSVMTFASLGYTPQVTASLLLDCLSDTLALKITHEYKKDDKASPFKLVPAYRSVAQVIQAATGENIEQRLEAELARV